MSDPLAEYSDQRVIHAEGRFGAKPPLGPPLQPPGGGGTYDGMEPRVARLDLSDVSHIKEDVSDLKRSAAALMADVSTLKVELAKLVVRVDHLPSKGFIVGSTLTGIGLIVGALTLFSRLGFLTPTP